MSLLSVACRSSGTPAWLLERARQEAEMAAQSRLVHDFRFTDRRQASGITFVNRVVDDAGKSYKLAHYDHGSGLCAADVDGQSLEVGQLAPRQLGAGGAGDRDEGHIDPFSARGPVR